MDGPGSSARRAPRRHSLGGRVVAAGAATRAHVAWLLGVDGAGGAWEVTAAGWMDHALEVAVSDGATEPAVFRIERRGSESAGLLLTEHLNVFCRGTDVPARLAEVVQRLGAERLLHWTTEGLAELVERDPEAGKPGLPMPPQPDDRDRPGTLLDTWGAPDAYADFFAGGEMARSQLDSIDPSKLFHFVQHCDNECLYVNPHSVGTVTTLVSFPWDDRIREPSRPFEQALGNMADREYIAEGMVTSDLDEDDVIRGNPDKLQRLLDHATSRPQSGDKTIFVSNTCVPTVIGEDVESRVAEAREQSGKPILYLTVTPRSMTNVFHDMLVERRLAAEAEAPAPERGKINLIGFAASRARDEIVSSLEELGVGVNACLLPELGPELVCSLPGAELSVLYPNELWQHLYDQLTEASRILHLTLPAPWGFEATRAWLERVARELGLDVDVGAWWAETCAPLARRWEALRREASGHRLGFVVRDRESYYLTRASATWGVPLVATAEEMGFGVDVLIHASSKRETRRAARAIHGLFREPERHSIRAFTSFDMLRQRLAESPADAFFTYHFFDWRVTEAGKSTFSLQHYEMGAAGAVRTLERLLHVCKTPFFRKYRRHLRRSTVGLRAPARSPRAGGER